MLVRSAASGSTTASQRNQRAPSSKSRSVGTQNAKLAGGPAGSLSMVPTSRPRSSRWRVPHSRRGAGPRAGRRRDRRCPATPGWSRSSSRPRRSLPWAWSQSTVGRRSEAGVDDGVVQRPGSRRPSAWARRWPATASVPAGPDPAGAWTATLLPDRARGASSCPGLDDSLLPARRRRPPIADGPTVAAPTARRWPSRSRAPALTRSSWVNDVAMPLDPAHQRSRRSPPLVTSALYRTPGMDRARPRSRRQALRPPRRRREPGHGGVAPSPPAASASRLTCWNSVRGQPGHRAVARTPVPRSSSCSALGEARDVGLAGRVDREPRRGLEAGDAADVQDPAPPPLQHRGSAARVRRVSATTLTSSSSRIRSGLDARPPARTCRSPASLTSRSTGRSASSEPGGDGLDSPRRSRGRRPARPRSAVRR